MMNKTPKHTSDFAPKSPSGFEPLDTDLIPCLDPSHPPPTHLYIPPGQQYRHVCPRCGCETILRSNYVSM